MITPEINEWNRGLLAQSEVLFASREQRRQMQDGLNVGPTRFSAGNPNGYNLYQSGK